MISANRSRLCYIGNVMGCNHLTTGEPYEFWFAITQAGWTCDKLTADQKKMPPMACDDAVIVDAGPDGISSMGMQHATHACVLC